MVVRLEMKPVTAVRLWAQHANMLRGRAAAAAEHRKAVLKDPRHDDVREFAWIHLVYGNAARVLRHARVGHHQTRDTAKAAEARGQKASFHAGRWSN